MSCGWKPSNTAPSESHGEQRCSLDADVVRMETARDVSFDVCGSGCSLDADVVRMETPFRSVISKRIVSCSLDADVVRMETRRTRRTARGCWRLFTRRRCRADGNSWMPPKSSWPGTAVHSTQMSCGWKRTLSPAHAAWHRRLFTRRRCRADGNSLSGGDRSEWTTAVHSTQMSCGWKLPVSVARLVPALGLFTRRRCRADGNT